MNNLNTKLINDLYSGDFFGIVPEYLMKHKRLRIEELLFVPPSSITIYISNGKFKAN